MPMEKIIFLIVITIVGTNCLCYSQTQTSNAANDWNEQQYGSFGKTVNEILSHQTNTNAEDILEALHYRITQKKEVRGEKSLTDTERKILAVDWLKEEVDNGGFDQYFMNSYGDDAQAALAGLKEIGDTNRASLLEYAIAVFPTSQPPTSQDKRQTIMERIAKQSKPVWDRCDSEFYALTNNLTDLTIAYAKKKKSEIILP
jgi:uncharacterized protein DUF4375